MSPSVGTKNYHSVCARPRRIEATRATPMPPPCAPLVVSVAVRHRSGSGAGRISPRPARPAPNVEKPQRRAAASLFGRAPGKAPSACHPSQLGRPRLLSRSVGEDVFEDAPPAVDRLAPIEALAWVVASPELPPSRNAFMRVRMSCCAAVSLSRPLTEPLLEINRLMRSPSDLRTSMSDTLEP